VEDAAISADHALASVATPVAELAWLADLDQPATQTPAKDTAAEAVDRLLATCWL